MLLALASGQFQPLYIPGHECGGFPPDRNGRRFPPMQSNHGFPHAACKQSTYPTNTATSWSSSPSYGQ
jgi:hypothetical protein